MLGGAFLEGEMQALRREAMPRANRHFLSRLGTSLTAEAKHRNKLTQMILAAKACPPSPQANCWIGEYLSWHRNAAHTR
jgi:hypothetical protein